MQIIFFNLFNLKQTKSIFIIYMYNIIYTNIFYSLMVTIIFVICQIVYHKIYIIYVSENSIFFIRRIRFGLN